MAVNHEAQRCNCDYEDLKRHLDRVEALSGHRYTPTSPRSDSWIAWSAAWDARQSEIDELKAKLEVAQVPEGFVLVDKKNIEHWYLNDRESMWWEHTDWLCDISIGEVEEVEHKQYLVADESKKYAAITWDEASDDVGYYDLFDTREEAEKAAAYCEAKFATQGEGYE